MKRYQIRTPDGWIVEDVIEEMAGKGWDAIRDLLDFSDCRAPLKDYRRFQNQLYHAVLPYIRAYRLCGMDEICLDLVESAPLSKDSDVFAVSPWDCIYHLFVPGTLESFVENAARNWMEAIEHLLEGTKKEAAFFALRKTFNDVLEDYLYWNPICGKARICTRSVPVHESMIEPRLFAAP